MINPFRPSAKVIIKKVEINMEGGEVPGERGGEDKIILRQKEPFIFKFLAGVSHNFTLANPYYVSTLLLNIKYSLFTYFEKLVAY